MPPGVLADRAACRSRRATSAASDALRHQLAARRDAEVGRLQRDLGAGQAAAGGLHERARRSEAGARQRTDDGQEAARRSWMVFARRWRPNRSPRRKRLASSSSCEGELHTALDTGSGHQRQIEELNHELQQGSALAAVAIETDLAAQRDMVAELTTTKAALQHELMDARDAASSRAAKRRHRARDSGDARNVDAQSSTRRAQRRSTWRRKPSGTRRGVGAAREPSESDPRTRWPPPRRG